MNLSDYQARTAGTAIYPAAGSGGHIAVIYTALGLTNEAGEVAGEIKKMMRDMTPLPAVRDKVIKEAGDTLWYLARLCAELGIDLSDVADANLAKLSDRQDRGVLGGSGGDR